MTRLGNPSLGRLGSLLEKLCQVSPKLFKMCLQVKLLVRPMTKFVEPKKIKTKQVNILTSRRKRDVIVVFIAILFLTLIVTMFLNKDAYQQGLLPASLSATLKVSSIYIFVLSLYCRFRFFWKFFLIYSFGSFFVVFVAFWAYAGGEANARFIFWAASLDFWVYLKSSTLLIALLTIPIKLFEKRRA